MLRAAASFWKVKKWSGHESPKTFPECRRHEAGKARKGVSPSRRISPEKSLGSERLYMHFCCILSAISVYELSQFCRYVGRNNSDNCYVWASDNTNILNTTISTLHQITMAHGGVVFLKTTLASFQLENPLGMNALSRFELFNFPSL